MRRRLKMTREGTALLLNNYHLKTDTLKTFCYEN